MTERMLRAYGKSWLNRTVLGLIFSVLGCLVFGCLVLGIGLIPDSLVNADIKPFLFIGVILLLGSVLVVGVIVWVVSTNRRVYGQLDQAFGGLGLEPSRYLISGRQYRGNFGGRQVNVYYHLSGGRYLRTPDLHIYIDGRFGTRLGIGTETALVKLAGSFSKSQPLITNSPTYDELVIYPLDENWARDLLGNPRAENAITQLVGKENPGLRSVLFAPESIQLRLRHFSLDTVTPENARIWIDALFDLISVAEQVPPPRQTAEASKWERSAQSDRGRFLLPSLLIVLLVVVCPLITVGLVFLGLYLAGQFP